MTHSPLDTIQFQVITRTASKTFNICYAHRVHNQSLILPKACKCKLLHGHNAAITFKLRYTQAAPMGDRGMHIDFNDFSGLKHFLDNYMDHRTLLGSDDPLITKPLQRLRDDELYDEPTNLVIADEVLLTTLGEKNPTNATQELLNSFVVINTPSPTSEAMAEWLATKIVPLYLVYLGTDVVTQPMSIVVSWSETESSTATSEYYLQAELLAKLSAALSSNQLNTTMLNAMFNPQSKPLTSGHINHDILTKAN